MVNDYCCGAMGLCDHNNVNKAITVAATKHVTNVFNNFYKIITAVANRGGVVRCGSGGILYVPKYFDKKTIIQNFTISEYSMDISLLSMNDIAYLDIVNTLVPVSANGVSWNWCTGEYLHDFITPLGSNRAERRKQKYRPTMKAGSFQPDISRWKVKGAR